MRESRYSKKYHRFSKYYFIIFLTGLTSLHFLLTLIYQVKLESKLYLKKIVIHPKRKNFTLPNFLTQDDTLKSFFWESLSELDLDDITFTLDTLFPGLTDEQNRNYATEKSLILDKDVNISKQYVDEYKEWPDKSYIWKTPLNQKIGTYIFPGIKDIQHIIWKHQHPSTCDDKKFLIIPSLFNGLGSSLHTMSLYLAKALDENKILAWGSETEMLTYTWNGGPYCFNHITEDQQKYIHKLEKRKHNQIKRNPFNSTQTEFKGYDCFFEQLTNCSYDIDINAMIIKREDTISNTYIPKIIKPIVNRLKIPQNLYYFYWRMCSTAYFVRYNHITNNWVNELEEDYLVNPGKNYDVSLYVRHGDKGSEMELVSNDQYVGAIKVIQKILNKDKLNVFLSTEDPETVKWFKENTNYTLSYFDFELDNYNIDQASKLSSILTRQMLANLKHSLFSKFVIGTIGSNWNRLIIELRMTTAGYANNYYFEVGDHVCLSIEHCKMLNKEFHMNW